MPAFANPVEHFKKEDAVGSMGRRVLRPKPHANCTLSVPAFQQPDRHGGCRTGQGGDTPAYGPRRTAEELRKDLAAAKRYAEQ